MKSILNDLQAVPPDRSRLCLILLRFHLTEAVRLDSTCRNRGSYSATIDLFGNLAAGRRHIISGHAPRTAALRGHRRRMSFLGACVLAGEFAVATLSQNAALRDYANSRRLDGGATPFERDGSARHEHCSLRPGRDRCDFRGQARGLAATGGRYLAAVL